MNNKNCTFFFHIYDFRCFYGTYMTFNDSYNKEISFSYYKMILRLNKNHINAIGKIFNQDISFLKRNYYDCDLSHQNAHKTICFDIYMEMNVNDS